MKRFFQITPVLILALSFVSVQCSKTESPVVPKSSSKSLDAPVVDGVANATSSFDASTNSYTMTVPGGTDITAIKFTFSLPAGATAKPASGSAQDFTKPVTYTVTAEDGSMQTFTVNVVYKSNWATSQDRNDAIRLKAQRVSGATVSSGLPSFAAFATNATVTDAETAYITNTGDFVKSYSDGKYTSWTSVDKTKLEYYSVGLTLATGELRVDKGIGVILQTNGSLYVLIP